jgi:TetR/AcrR family transcriptional repressor of nem operon
MTINAREAILLAARNIAQSQGYNGLNFRDLATAALEVISQETPDALDALRRFPEIFRRSLEADNRLCLGSFVGAETDNLPAEMTQEIQAFAEVNVAWLSKLLVAANVCEPADSEKRARAIFSAVAGAQLIARSRSDISLFDSLIETYRAYGPLPT